MQRKEATTLPGGERRRFDERSARDNREARPDAHPETVLSTTEARQASPRRMNLRVLIGSLVLMGVLGFALTIAFWGSAPEAPVPTATAPAPEPGSAPVTAPVQAPAQIPAQSPAAAPATPTPTQPAN